MNFFKRLCHEIAKAHRENAQLRIEEERQRMLQEHERQRIQARHLVDVCVTSTNSPNAIAKCDAEAFWKADHKVYVPVTVAVRSYAASGVSYQKHFTDIGMIAASCAIEGEVDHRVGVSDSKHWVHGIDYTFAFTDARDATLFNTNYKNGLFGHKPD